MRKNKRLLIENGFFPSQLLWILIIASEYCKNKQIKELVIQRKQLSIFKNKLIKKEFKNIKIVSVEDLLPFYLKRNFFLYLLLLPKSILLSFFWNKKNSQLLDWYDYQFFHSIIDTYQSLSKDGTIKPNYLVLLKSVYLNLKKEKIAEHLSSQNISAVITSHNVYTVKTFNSVFRKKKIPVFCQAVSNIYRQPEKKDESWNILHNRKLRKKLLKKISYSVAHEYWTNKFLGKGDYFDSNLAYKKQKFNRNIKIIVMLHIIRDSPYLALDKSRIFINYVDWIDHTIKIISKSKEKWYFKIHPNSKNWGENPKVLLYKLIKNNKAKNITILDNGNLKLMKNLNKVVTFSGSASYEAISLGIKPVIISNNSICHYDKSTILKPKNLKEYEKILLSRNYKKFKTSKEQIKLAKKFIYINEKIMTLTKDLNSLPIYRSEKKKKAVDYVMVNKSLKKNLPFLKKLGHLISKGLTHTLSRKGLELIY